MTWMNFARAGKIIALVAFLMPWLVVSCQGTEVASATGLDMVVGSIDSAAGQSGQDPSPQWWAILALVAIVGGMVASFRLTPVRTAALAVMGSAGLAFLVLALGMFLAISSAKSEMRQQSGASADNPFAAGIAQEVNQAIRFEPQFGYWLALLALAGSAGSGFMLFSGRAVPTSIVRVGDQLRTAAASAASGAADAAASASRPARPVADDDVAYWDAMPNKTDPAALEEYLYRFPEGRFAGLARERLQRTSSAD